MGFRPPETLSHGRSSASGLSILKDLALRAIARLSKQLSFELHIGQGTACTCSKQHPPQTHPMHSLRSLASLPCSSTPNRAHNQTSTSATCASRPLKHMTNNTRSASTDNTLGHGTTQDDHTNTDSTHRLTEQHRLTAPADAQNSLPQAVLRQTDVGCVVLA